MINSVDEFVRLRTSNVPAEYQRAAHEQAPEQVWWGVIAQYPGMTIWVIRNKMIQMSILDHLARHSDPTVRSEVARKRKLSSDLFRLLANDSDEGVRLTVTNNARVPRDILEHLAQDECWAVAESARLRIASER